MQENKKQKRRRQIAVVMAVLLILVMLAGLLTPIFYSVQGAPLVTTADVIENETILPSGKKKEMGQDRFSMEMEIGYDQTYVVSGVTPFRGLLTNLGKDFDGIVRVKAYFYQESGMPNSYNNKTAYTYYDQPVTLAQGAAQEIKMDIRIPGIQTFIEITVIDQNEKVVFRKNIKVRALDPNLERTMVLTERAEDLSYLSALSLVQSQDGNGVQTSPVFATAKNFPDQESLMEGFAGLIIEDFDTKTLSEQQKTALLSWLKAGGCLILGTGAQAQKVLGGLPELMLTIGAASQINALSGLPNVSLASSPMRLTQITGDGMQPYVTQDGQAVISYMPYKGGRVLINHFAMSQSPATDIAGFGRFLSDAYKEALSLRAQTTSGFNPNYWGYMTDSFPVMESKTVYLIEGAIVFYILMIGPILYFVLKKKDKREYGWVLVPVLSVVFVLGIFMIGRTSQYQNGMLNVISISEIQPNTSIAKTQLQVAVRSPQKGTVHLQMEDTFLPQIETDEMYGYRGSSSNKDKVSRVILPYGERTGTGITYFDQESWSSNRFYTTLQQDIGGSLESTVQLIGDRYTGEVINHTTLDFKDVLLNIGGQYLQYDTLKAGESILVDHTITESMYSEEGSYSILRKIYGDIHDRYALNQRIKDGELTQEEAFSLMLKWDLLSRCMDEKIQSAQEMLQGEIPIQIYAFNNASVLTGEKQLNGKVPNESSLHLYQAQFSIPLSENIAYDIPLGQLFFQYYENDYNRNNGVQHVETFANGQQRIHMGESGEVTCAFPVALFPKVSAFTIEPVSLTNGVEIHNVQTNEWETLLETEYTDMAAFQAEDGSIYLRIHMPSNSSVILPSVRLKGGTPNAND